VNLLAHPDLDSIGVPQICFHSMNQLEDCWCRGHDLASVEIKKAFNQERRCSLVATKPGVILDQTEAERRSLTGQSAFSKAAACRGRASADSIKCLEKTPKFVSPQYHISSIWYATASA
jgi:hypothetical protein